MTVNRARATARRVGVVACATVALAACGGGGDSSDTTSPVDGPTTTTVPARPCEPTPDAPWRGMAAITEKYRVRVWDKLTTEHTEFEQIGDDPNAEQVMGDYNVVETVAVDPGTCRVFVGTCCEPVSGITYYDVNKPVEEWGILYGHYPTISPDGTRVAYSGYEEVTVASLDDPQTAIATIKQPGAEDATIYDMIWTDDDNLVLLGFSEEGAYLWKITVGTATMADPVQITPYVTRASGDIWSVGLVGVDRGHLLVRVPGDDGARVQLRSLNSFDLEGDEPFDATQRSYRISSGRVMSVSQKGRLMAFPVGAEDALFIGGDQDLYVWAG